MHQFSVLNAGTGEVLRNGQASTLEDVYLQAGPDERIVYGEQIEPGSRIENGTIVAPDVTAPEPTIEDVKSHAARLLRYTDWRVLRAAEGGKPVPQDVLDGRSLIRQRSNEIEAMVPIPPDFRDDRFWI